MKTRIISEMNRISVGSLGRRILDYGHIMVVTSVGVVGVKVSCVQ